MTEPERAPESPIEASFIAALPDIERAIRVAGHRSRMSQDEIADFGSMVKLSLIESRYRVLAKYEGRSSLRTYLNTVVRRLLVDFLRSRHGKWRCSARARKFGSKGIELERLIARDGLTPMEAATALATRDDTTVEPFLAIARELPHRRRWFVLSIDDADSVSAADLSLLPEQLASVRQVAERLDTALKEAFEQLHGRDRKMIRLRFEQGLCAHEIAAVLDMPPKQIYRRCERILRRLRVQLLEDGLAWNDVARAADWPGWILRWPEEPAQTDASPRTDPSAWAGPTSFGRESRAIPSA